MMVLVVIFSYFEFIMFCFVENICDLVHDVQAMFHIPYLLFKHNLEIFSEI